MSSPSCDLIRYIAHSHGSADRRNTGKDSDSLQTPSVPGLEGSPLAFHGEGADIYLSHGRPPCSRACGRAAQWSGEGGLLRVARVWGRERTLPSGSGRLRLGTDQEATTVLILCTLCVSFLFAVWPLASPQICARSPASSTY